MRYAAIAVVALLLSAVPGGAATTRHGLGYTSSEVINTDLGRIDGALPLTGQPVESLVACGQIDGGSGSIYLGPANVADATGENGEGSNAQASAGGTVCNALDSGTEATADAPAYTNLAMRVVGMMCKAVTDTGASGSGSNGVTFTLRSAAADTSPVLSCTVPTTGIECRATPTSAALSPVIAAGATVAVKAAVTETITGGDGWCRVWYTVF